MEWILGCRGHSSGVTKVKGQTDTYEHWTVVCSGTPDQNVSVCLVPKSSTAQQCEWIVARLSTCTISTRRDRNVVRVLQCGERWHALSGLILFKWKPQDGPPLVIATWEQPPFIFLITEAYWSSLHIQWDKIGSYLKHCIVQPCIFKLVKEPFATNTKGLFYS